jgi:hypothetical protein
MILDCFAPLAMTVYGLSILIWCSFEDTRVKPAYDAEYRGGYSAACCATVGVVPATVARRMSRGCD